MRPRASAATPRLDLHDREGNHGARLDWALDTLGSTKTHDGSGAASSSGADNSRDRRTVAAAVVPRLSQLLAPVVEGTGHDLEGLEVTPAGRRRVVRMLVDKDGGTTLDDVADVSRAVSAALDDIDAREPALLGGAYVLEVSSPGVDRPLVAPRHWRRNVGRLVTAHLADGTSATGRLAEASDSAVVLGERRLPLAQVVRGQVQVEFDRAGPGAADRPADDDQMDGDLMDGDLMDGDGPEGDRDLEDEDEL